MKEKIISNVSEDVVDVSETPARLTLKIESLEPRIAPTTIVPTNTLGPGRTAGWGC